MFRGDNCLYFMIIVSFFDTLEETAQSFSEVTFHDNPQESVSLCFYASIISKKLMPKCLKIYSLFQEFYSVSHRRENRVIFGTCLGQNISFARGYTAVPAQFPETIFFLHLVA